MPRSYKNKGERNNWNEDDMAGAISSCVEKKMALKTAADTFDVPRTTLRRKLEKLKSDDLSVEQASDKKQGRNPVFNKEQEKELADHILSYESALFGLTQTDVRKLAYDLAAANGIKHLFNTEKEIAGYDWLYNFLKRNPQISLRTPEQTSIMRARGFNRTVVNQFYDLLESLFKKYKFSPQNIYNVDETAISTTNNKPSRIMALKGKKQVGCITSADRGVLTTMVACMSASGYFLPPMFVFPRKRENPLLLDNAIPGSFAVYHESGWIQKETFIVWFKRFIELANPSPKKPALLLFDGHSSHTKSVELIKLAKENNVHLICFPPHCTHRLQPLDVSFMAPLKTYYQQACRSWMLHNPGRAITIYQVGQLVKEAFIKAALIKTAINGFQNTEIFPFDRHIISEDLYAPSDVTDHPMGNDIIDASRPTSRQSIMPTVNIGNMTDDDSRNISDDNSRNISSLRDISVNDTNSNQVDNGSTLLSEPSTSNFRIRPNQISPIPHEGPRTSSKPSRRTGKTAILTDENYIADLEETPPPKKPKLSKKNKTTAKSSENEKKTASQPTIKIVEEEDILEACIFCNELYIHSSAKENWIQCIKCKHWAHEACTDYEGNLEYTCDFCSI